MAESLLSEEQIAGMAFPPSKIKICGIYFLLSEGKVMYVGQSTNLHTRLQQHQSRRKFDALSFIECDRHLLDELESRYIHALHPPWNGRGAKGTKNAPMSIKQLQFENRRTP